jgi:hypothetical protein
VIRVEWDSAGRARVAGALVGESVRVLEGEISRDGVVLDLSGVERADEGAVRLLARLRPDRCTLVSCPRWLALWVDRVRR